MLRWNPFTRGGAEDTPIGSVRFVVVDTELTSLDRRTNRLLSVGAIAMHGPRILVGEQYYRVVNPGVPVPKEAVVIHRLRPEDVEHGDTLPESLRDLAAFLDDAVLVAHCADIDRRVLRKEFSACGMKLDNNFVCTSRAQQWIVKRQSYKEDTFHDFENTDLASLAQVYKLDFRESHHALDDAFITAQLWQKQLHILGSMGITTLGKLLAVTKI